MSSNANRSWTAACRRRLAAALCVLMLLAGLLPTHVFAQAVPARFVQAIVLVTQTGDEEAPAKPYAVAGHAAGQCICKIAALPAAAEQRVSCLSRPALFAAASSPSSRPGALAPPSEPPRA